MIDKIMYFLLLIFALSTNISTGITSMAIIIGVVFTAIKLVIKKEKINIDKSLLIMISVFSIIEIIVGILGLNPMEGIKQAFSEIYRFLPLFFAVFFIKTKKQILNIVIAFALSVLLNDSYGLYQYLVLGNIRPVGFNNTATFYASHMLMAIFFLYLTAKDYLMNLIQKTFCYSCVFFSVVMLFLSGTRGGWVALIITIVALVIFSNMVRRELIITTVGICIVILTVFLVSPFFQTRVLSIVDLKDNSNKERILMWNSSIAIFKDNPIHGIGHNSFKDVYNNKYISPEAKEVGHTHPHNNFFKALSEGGIIGATGYVVFYGFLFYYFYNKYKSNNSAWYIAALAFMFAIHIEGLTDWNTGQVPIMREFWFLLGMVIANENIKIDG